MPLLVSILPWRKPFWQNKIIQYSLAAESTHCWEKSPILVLRSKYYMAFIGMLMYNKMEKCTITLSLGLSKVYLKQNWLSKIHERWQSRALVNCTWFANKINKHNYIFAFKMTRKSVFTIIFKFEYLLFPVCSCFELFISKQSNAILKPTENLY